MRAMSIMMVHRTTTTTTTAMGSRPIRWSFALQAKRRSRVGEQQPKVAPEYIISIYVGLFWMHRFYKREGKDKLRRFTVIYNECYR